jgi:hypothetical protein
MPHFRRRVDIDQCAVGGAKQAGVVGNDGHCSCSKAKAPIASKASAGSTTGGTNQANI